MGWAISFIVLGVISITAGVVTGFLWPIVVGAVMVGLVAMLVVVQLGALLVCYMIPSSRGLMETILYPAFRIVSRWAERYFYFVKIPEGYAVDITEGGAFRRSEIQWVGHTLNRETWDVIPDGTTIGGQAWREPWHPWGGIRFMGLRGKAYAYRLRWHSLREDDTVAPHDEVLKQIMLKDHNYYVIAKEIEDVNGIPVDFGFLVVMCCTNPRKFIFEVQDPLEMMAGLFAARFTGYVGTRPWQEITRHKEDAERALWGTLEQTDTLSDLEDKYGMVLKRALLKKVDPKPEHQRLAILPYEATQEGQAVVITAEARGRAIAGKFKAFIRGLLPF